MRTTKTTLFTAVSGANAQCIGESRHRVRLEFHYATTSSQNFLLDSVMTTAGTGIVLNSTLSTKVFTVEEHGDLVTRSWNVWGSAANPFIIIETFNNEN